MDAAQVLLNVGIAIFVGLVLAGVPAAFAFAWRTSAALAAFKLECAEKYATHPQIAAFRAELHEVRRSVDEMARLLVRLETLIEPRPSASHGND